MTTTTRTPLADCLDRLDLEDGDLLSLGVQPPGGAFKGSQTTVAALKELDPAHTFNGVNAWAGLQPMRRCGSRGKAADVLRLVALYADLDVGPGKLGTFEDCIAVIRALSDMLGARPVYVVMSGHGYQPVWAVERDADVEDMPAMRALMSRWGQLVQQVARTHGGHADSVYDVSRVLRLPGTVNWKDPDNPVRVEVVLTDDGAPVSVEQIRECLDTYLTDEEVPADDGPAFEGADPPETSCRYATTMIAAWSRDLPGERHPWALRNGMKLAALKRLGCITQVDFEAAVEVLVKRMEWLCQHHGTPRDFQRAEIVGKHDSIIESGVRRAATYSECALRTALGGHRHTEEEDLSWIPGAHTDPDAPKRSDKVPAVHPAVWHGPAGDYVKAIAADTESDRLAVLVHVLAWAGCRQGRSVWVQHGNTRHYPLVWPLIVGRTSTGRKGNAEHDSLSALSSLTALPRRRSGLSSGEGLMEVFMSRGDDPPPDPRLLIVESEWEGVLARVRREGNSLSAVLRDAWDGRTLATMNATQSREVPHHSLAVVGHITPQALREGMTGADLSNGFLNRFLPVYVHRPHLVPWPKPSSPEALELLGIVVDRAAAAVTGPLALTDAARAVYTDWYGKHEKGREDLPERVAMATARAVPNMLRVALIYAVLDASAVIDVDHLVAAAALIQNSAESARMLLGVGKAGLDGKILTALRESGPMTTTDLHKHFSGHVSATDLNEALEVLVNSGEVTRTKDTDTGGRPAIRYSVSTSSKRSRRSNSPNGGQG